MSRQNPATFAFSILFEIAAVVAIVSLLPRIDLRPTVSASQSFEPATNASFQPSFQSPVIESPGWTNTLRQNPPASVSAAPPLIEDNVARPQYVEQRLDRASQQLLNSVGGAVNHAAEEWLRPSPNSGQPEVAARPIINQPPQYQPQQQPANSRATEPRRWLRY